MLSSYYFTCRAPNLLRAENQTLITSWRRYRSRRLVPNTPALQLSKSMNPGAGLIEYVQDAELHWENRVRNKHLLVRGAFPGPYLPLTHSERWSVQVCVMNHNPESPIVMYGSRVWFRVLIN